MRDALPVVVSLSKRDHFMETRHISEVVLKMHLLPLRLNSFSFTPSSVRADGWSTYSSKKYTPLLCAVLT